MVRKIRNTISVSLVIIFLMPMSIKLLDGLFHHHVHLICTAKDERHLHEHHEKCPIPGYEFSLYTLNKILIETQKAFYCDGLTINYTSNYCNSKSKYSFLFRAPPVFTNNIIQPVCCKSTYL
jgi:hypothetical protein